MSRRCMSWPRRVAIISAGSSTNFIATCTVAGDYVTDIPDVTYEDITYTLPVDTYTDGAGTCLSADCAVELSFTKDGGSNAVVSEVWIEFGAAPATCGDGVIEVGVDPVITSGSRLRGSGARR